MGRRIAPVAIIPMLLAVTACATARLHSEAELDRVGLRCGLGLGELVQDESEKRLLFLFRVAPKPAARECVRQWARQNHLRVVFIDALNEPQS